MAVKLKNKVATSKGKSKPFLVKVDPNILERVKKHNEKTGAQIGKFYDNAALEKLEREK